MLRLWLDNFTLATTREYIREQERIHPNLHVDESLVQALHRITNGHPGCLAFAVHALLKTQPVGRNLTAEEFEREFEQVKLASGAMDAKSYMDALISIFLRLFPLTEQRELKLCAVPRMLDAKILKVVLQIGNDDLANDRWKQFRQYTFMRPINEQQAVLDPLLRRLLLLKSPASRDLDSDYQRIHILLRDYFHRRSDEQARIEEVYHELALGNPEVAITCATNCVVGQQNLNLFDSLLEAVKEAPTGLIPQNAQQLAFEAQRRAAQLPNVQDSMIAIVLSNWLSAVYSVHTRTSDDIPDNRVIN